MKPTAVLLIPVLALFIGCAVDRTQSMPGLIQVTIPNESTPAEAPRAAMNDDLRKSGWNHGNGALWVGLYPRQFVVSADEVRKDGSIEVKFGWWRGIRGTFSISGRRLDASAPPLRYSLPPVKSYGDLGFLPTSLIFPTVGYWEVTGHLDDRSLTFVVHVTIKSSANQSVERTVASLGSFARLERQNLDRQNVSPSPVPVAHFER